MFEDVAGDEGFVDARIFVRLQMLQRILGDALMLCSFCHCQRTFLQASERA